MGEDTSVTHCPIPMPSDPAIPLEASMAAYRQDTTTSFHPGYYSGSRATSPFLTFWKTVSSLAARRRRARMLLTRSTILRRCVAASVTRPIIGCSMEQADTRSHRPASLNHPAWSAMRTRCCRCVPVGSPASGLKSPLHRIGRRGSNISTTTSAASPACFRRARVTNRRSISRCCAWASITRWTGPAPVRRQRKLRPLIPGLSHRTTGISTGNSR